MFCSYRVLINHSWGKSEALRKMVHHFLDTNDCISKHFKRLNATEKVFIWLFWKRIKFKWSTLRRCSQCGSKFNGRWNASEHIWRTCMFLIFGWRIWTILIASVSNHHFLFPDSISWEFSDLRCTSQGVFPPSAVQTLVPLSGNKWSVSWSCKPASHCYSLDVGCFRRVETLSIRMGSSLHFRVWIISYVFVDNGSHERGQTSRPVVGAEIQTNCNFEAHIYHCRYSLYCNLCRYSMQRVRFSYSALVWSNCHLMLPINLDCFIC